MTIASNFQRNKTNSVSIVIMFNVAQQFFFVAPIKTSAFKKL